MQLRNLTSKVEFDPNKESYLESLVVNRSKQHLLLLLLLL